MTFSRVALVKHQNHSRLLKNSHAAHNSVKYWLKLIILGTTTFTHELIRGSLVFNGFSILSFDILSFSILGFISLLLHVLLIQSVKVNRCE